MPWGTRDWSPAPLLQMSSDAVGTHGRGGFKRLVLGSIASEVVRHARCNVLPAAGPGGCQVPGTSSAGSPTASCRSATTGCWPTATGRRLWPCVVARKRRRALWSSQS
ncbi:MAG: universal stress protein [Acidobacteria bacterium]|nr:universal stress protein [Acidobacteriota bacterium]